MDDESGNSESKVSGNQANIPVHIRRELGIGDGDTFLSQIEDDCTLRVQVIQQHSGTFSDFDGYDGDQETSVSSEHDTWDITHSERRSELN